MESAPPSYENATLVDCWDIVARYMPSHDLTAAALVCSRWHSTFTPHIWGNPASHFGVENDRVYVALTRFSRNLKTARLLVRSLTHTLHFPPAQAEIYNGPHTEWLRDMVERLPNLQSLVVRGLPFFDHGAIHALVSMRKYTAVSPPLGMFELPAPAGGLSQRPTAIMPSFGLRLLDASKCPNVTSSGLALALSRFEGLLYLDLSFTYPSRSPDVLISLGKCTGLQVLKLRGISLRDAGVEILCKSIGLHVRSLDVRDNELTDRSVKALLDHCFTSNGGDDVRGTVSSPSLLPYLGSEMLEVYQGEDFESYLRNAFTGRFVSRLAIEDTPVCGITHMYIAGNALTVDGVSRLLRTGRLHVLDAGTATNTCSEPSALAGTSDCGALTPILANYAAHSLSFLRIGHDLVTKMSTSEQMVRGGVELEDTALPASRSAAELESTSLPPEIFEMGVDHTIPVYELPGDSAQRFPSPSVDHTFHIPQLIEPTDNVRRGSAFAPEVFDEVGVATEQLNHGISIVTTESSSKCASPTSSSTTLNCSLRLSPSTRPRSYSSMAMDRKARLAARKSAGNNLHLSMLPHLTTLVLTEFPPFTTNREVADRIIDFIKNCAQEASWARSEAELDYALPPGRRGQASTLEQSATKLFALKRLVLELAPAKESGNAGSPWPHTKSMTEDQDSEKLWSAAERDFSFFGDEECVFPTIEADSSDSISATNEKEVSFGRRPPTPTRVSLKKPMIDNIALISQFRKERKLAHQRSVAAGDVGAEVDGLWNGVVQVVRNNNESGHDEEMDYYGNRFSYHYLYR